MEMVLWIPGTGFVTIYNFKLKHKILWHMISDDYVTLWRVLQSKQTNGNGLFIYSKYSCAV